AAAPGEPAPGAVPSHPAPRRRRRVRRGGGAQPRALRILPEAAGPALHHRRDPAPPALLPLQRGELRLGLVRRALEPSRRREPRVSRPASTLTSAVRTAPGWVMGDPGNSPPYYIDSLCRSLADLGVPARVVSSPPLFEPVDPEGRYAIDRFFFPSMRGPIARLTRHRRRLRQAMKAIGYPAGLWRTWRALRSRAASIFHLHWALVPALDGLLLGALRARGWGFVSTAPAPLPPADGRAPGGSARLLAHVDAAIVHTPHLGQQ